MALWNRRLLIPSINRMAFRNLCGVAAALAVCATVGCSTASPTTPTPVPVSPVGQYVLVGAAKQTLPAVVADQVVGTEHPFRLKVEVTEGELLLRNDGSYEHRVKRRSFADGVPILSPDWVDRGRWSLSGAVFLMTSEVYEDHQITGTVQGSTMSLVQNLSGDPEAVPPVTFEYRR